jgi:hypothetical protein
MWRAPVWICFNPVGLDVVHPQGMRQVHTCPSLVKAPAAQSQPRVARGANCRSGPTAICNEFGI